MCGYDKMSEWSKNEAFSAQTNDTKAERFMVDKNLKLFTVLLFLISIFFTNSANAVEEIVAKTKRPAAKIVKEEVEYYEPYVQTDGMEIPNPFQKRVKPILEPAIPAKENTLTMDSDEIEYNGETNEVEARGHVLVIAQPENIRLSADRGVYNRSTNIIKLYDNVTLHKDGAEIVGDYMVVDLNEENILMNEPTGTFDFFKITGREGYAYTNKIESINGEIELAKKMDVTIASYGFGSYYDPTIIQANLATDEMKKKRTEPYKLHTKEIIIKSEKDHDIVTFKNVDIYYKKFKLITAKNVQIYTDKEQNYIETNVPEIGSMSGFGTYAGPGFVTKGPLGSTIKIVPSLVLDGGLGFGGIARVHSKRNTLEAGWASSSKNLIGRGKYKFNKDLRFEYARHSYMDEGLFGHRRAGYLAQLVHQKTWDVPNLDAKFTQRISAGYVAEYSKEHQEDMPGTSRLRWQADLNKPLFSIGDKEQDMFLNLSGVAQVGATVYGTGDTVGIFRVGPSIQSRVRNWGSKINFAMAGIHGASPYRFDEYRYGKVSIYIDQNYRFNRYLAAGYQGAFAPLKDNHDKKLVTENRFYVMAGPEDVKAAISYDTEREIAAFDILFLLGSDNMKAKYDKLTIENVETLGKKRDFFEDMKFRKIQVPEADDTESRF